MAGSVRSNRHRELLSKLKAKGLLQKKIRIVSTDKVPIEEQREVDKMAGVKEGLDILDPRLKHSKQKVNGVFTGIVNDRNTRYRRAPDVLNPADVDLPVSDWVYNEEKELSADERWQLAWTSLCRQFEIERMSMEDTLPWRIRVAYRITRELARLKGLVSDDEPLAAALTPSRDCVDPWTYPTEERYPPPGRPAQNAIAREALATLRRAREDLELVDQPCKFPVAHSDETEPQLLGRGGLALLPPEVPWRWRDPDTHEVIDTYDESYDPMLQQWVHLVEVIAGYMQIERGSEEDPDLGRLGLLGLVEPETVRMLWPSRLQIIYWEEQLIQETLRLLVDKGTPQTKQALKDKHGLTEAETRVLVKLAFQLARDNTDVEVEEQRAVMVLRLEEFVRRSREAMELRAELAALKQLSIVQGLSKTDPEDSMHVFGSIVKKFDEIDIKTIETNPGRGLPG